MAIKQSWRLAARWTGGLILLGSLAACEEGAMPGFLQGGDRPETETAAEGDSAPRAVKLVERDVEAPEVFQATEAGLWDGRPSLGGVWVAHPDVGDPERVIIRNEANGKFVIGALFRRERDNPGPKLQVSSDAADTLGMLAGQPVKLNVTALRREEVAPEPIAAPDAAPADADAPTVALAKPEAIASASLDAPAPDSVATPAPKPAAAETAAAKPAPAPATASGLSKPFIQIGIFSVEKNAENTATSLRQIGILPTVRKQESSGKTFWRVVVGPTTTSAERAQILAQVKKLGFQDAYFVSN